MVVKDRGWSLGKMGGRDQKAHTSGYKINKSWDGMYHMVTIANNTVSHL